MSTPFAFLIISMNLLSKFGTEWCTFDKQKGHSNLKTIFYDYALSVLCAWKDFQNLMKWL